MVLTTEIYALSHSWFLESLVGVQETWAMDEAAHRAIADIEAGRQVVCTMQEYYATVRMALQRYAMAQAAQGNPEVGADHRRNLTSGYSPGGRPRWQGVSLALGTHCWSKGDGTRPVLGWRQHEPACAAGISSLTGIGRVGDDL